MSPNIYIPNVNSFSIVSKNNLIMLINQLTGLYMMVTLVVKGLNKEKKLH